MARKLVSNLVNVPLVTALPTVTEATEVYYQNAAMATTGARWHLIYNPVSASAYKWECVGGSPLTAQVITNESTASTTYVALATAGPAITLPLAGDYIVEQGFLFNNVSAGVVGLMSYDAGAAPAADSDAVRGYNAAAADIQANVMRRQLKAGLGALTLTSKYRLGAGPSGFFGDRWISALPVRVG